MEHRIFGYARVSAKGQNLARQVDALRKFPIEEGRIYTDKSSGKDFNRPAYYELISKLQSGDTIVVKSIDRLGRNYNEVLNEWRRITKEMGCAMVVLDMPLLDTRASSGDITGIFIADLTLQLLSYIAQIERENIRQRQAEGIAAAQARGVRFGRPPKERPKDYIHVRNAFLGKSLSKRKAAVSLNVSVATFEKWLQQDAEYNHVEKLPNMETCSSTA